MNYIDMRNLSFFWEESSLLRSGRRKSINGFTVFFSLIPNCYSWINWNSISVFTLLTNIYWTFVQAHHFVLLAREDKQEAKILKGRFNMKNSTPPTHDACIIHITIILYIAWQRQEISTFHSKSSTDHLLL